MKTVKNSFLAIVSMLLLAAAVNPAVSFAAEKGAEQELGNSLSLASLYSDMPVSYRGVMGKI